MTSKLNPYISLDGDARQALDFYHGIFGGKLDAQTFKEFGMEVPPEDADKLMHGSLVADNGISIMVADTPNGMEYKPGTNVSMCLNGDDDSQLSSYFEQLSNGGNVTEPLVQAPWGDKFGMVTDKFGVRWMVNISGSQSAAQ